jgi:hypothetical protein
MGERGNAFISFNLGKKKAPNKARDCDWMDAKWRKKSLAFLSQEPATVESQLCGIRCSKRVDGTGRRKDV